MMVRHGLSVSLLTGPALQARITSAPILSEGAP